MWHQRTTKAVPIFKNHATCSRVYCKQQSMIVQFIFARHDCCNIQILLHLFTVGLTVCVDCAAIQSMKQSRCLRPPWSMPGGILYLAAYFTCFMHVHRVCHLFTVQP